MKLLRSPYVIGVLIALALVLVFFQTRKKPAVAIAAPAPPKKTQPQMVQPDVGIEAAQAGWVQSPRRDLFRFPPLLTQEISQPVDDVLSLKAVWLQETGAWAVINGKVVGEGDTILDFQVEKILADRVLVQGAGGRKTIGFKGSSSPQSQAARSDVIRTGTPAPKSALSQRPPLLGAAEVAGKPPQKPGRQGGKIGTAF